MRKVKTQKNVRLGAICAKCQHKWVLRKQPAAWIRCPKCGAVEVL